MKELTEAEIREAAAYFIEVLLTRIDRGGRGEMALDVDRRCPDGCHDIHLVLGLQVVEREPAKILPFNPTVH